MRSRGADLHPLQRAMLRHALALVHKYLHLVKKTSRGAPPMSFRDACTSLTPPSFQPLLYST